MTSGSPSGYSAGEERDMSVAPETALWQVYQVRSFWALSPHKVWSCRQAKTSSWLVTDCKGCTKNAALLKKNKNLLCMFPVTWLLLTVVWPPFSSLPHIYSIWMQKKSLKRYVNFSGYRNWGYCTICRILRCYSIVCALWPMKVQLC